MKPAKLRWHRFSREEEGATAIEYAILLSLIVVAVLASVGQMATATKNSFDKSGEVVNAALGS
ncbi:Flp family type IVb pilin [Pirellula sp. SH-Sr6A]|uniref:Flp family type IVb pilin n=1 Tax=Pirellula sp. SH-Sr6A TaxID=1632865 RepID=UPI00143B2CAE|nr:Flp family type IVb pilin [Pirellula sp. SH-Sr6A]